MSHIIDTRNGPAIEHKGKTYFLQEQAYAENSIDGYAYFAEALDITGKHGVRVTWEVLNHDAEEECNACNWDNYLVIGEYTLEAA